MLSRVSTKSGKALCRSALRSAVSRVATKDARRAFVQPSGADRASVVDVPSSYQEDTAFAPRVGEEASHGQLRSRTDLSPDMFGFKLESSRREGGVSEKARPIYLDMQVSLFAVSWHSARVLNIWERQQRPWIPVYWMLCSHISPTSTATRTVGHTHMAGRRRKPSRMLARCVEVFCNVCQGVSNSSSVRSRSHRC